MAGVAGFGALEECLESPNQITLNHRLESVKILPPPPEGTEAELWGYVTAQGVSLAEINEPFRQRIFCMAVTSADNLDQGRPSSWSGELDQLAAGVDSNRDIRRLFVVSAGNCDLEVRDKYPNAQLSSSVQDPAQAWNVLTVGAYTALDTLTDPSIVNCRPLALNKGSPHLQVLR
jgi:hypothetical protein